ncbi:virulence factor TspB C-terminal domain-related protein [Acinetobacter sp.]|uniref:virulence factor TspB C-terminal domain-related protein n=1 Tax=Acinetobacter sp. TaxID=472 RepID=UPI003981B36D
MKKFLVFLLSLTICLTPSLTFAGLASSGWTLSNPVAKGASTLYNGAKNVIINGKSVAKASTALITPTASQVAKLLGKGVAGVALSFAVEQLLGKVDWVLDPANNQIRYKEKDAGGVAQPTDNFCWYGNSSGKSICYSSIESAANAECPVFMGIGAKFSGRIVEANSSTAYVRCELNGGERYATVNKIVNPAYDPNAVPQDKPEKTIPLDTVAAKVISNAESGNKDAQVATTAAAADIVNDAQKDDAKARPIVNQLEANSKTETDADAGNATGETKPNTTTGGTDLSLTFPVFCSWAPTICEAAQTVISFPTTLTDWWNESKQKTDSWAKSISDAYASTKEWFQKEPEKDKDGTQVDVDTPTPFDNSVFSKDRFAVSRQCPIPEQHTISLSGVSVNFSFDMTPLCQVLILARPALVACSYLYAAYIVIGAARNG